MIGKPEWFGRRKYGGWGICPVKWQGWIYILFMIVPLIFFQSLPFWSNTIRFIVTGIWILILVVDTIDIMVRMKKDERETIHEAIAERNAMWVMTAVLAIAIAYQVAVSAINQAVEFDWWIVIALSAGLFMKAATNIYLDKKN